MQPAESISIQFECKKLSRLAYCTIGNFLYFTLYKFINYVYENLKISSTL